MDGTNGRNPLKVALIAIIFYLLLLFLYVYYPSYWDGTIAQSKLPFVILGSPLLIIAGFFLSFREFEKQNRNRNS